MTMQQEMNVTDAEMHLFYALDMLSKNPVPGPEQDFYLKQLQIARQLMQNEILDAITGEISAYTETTKEELDGRR